MTILRKVFLVAVLLAGAAMLASSPANAKPAAKARPAAKVQSRFATVNGVKLHYLIAGKGSPVLLLHGFAETSHMWLPLIAKLAPTHTVIAPDLRGYGESAKPATGYGKKNMAVDIHALMESLGDRHIELVGHDIGLMVAYAYAAQFPDEVERIVLMDAFL
ncbi:MAG: alpha/beta fold hydrolase, partial [bacterium]